MTYFFILGSNPTLSLAELSAIFHLTNSRQIAGENVFILKTDKKINAVQLIKKLGGTIKIWK